MLYLPAGVYRITKGLTMTNRQSLSILGEDPAKTEIKWDGPEEVRMLLCNGVCYAKFARITWNGGGKKVTAIFHESENTKGVGTSNEHSDQVFVDVAFGIRAGKPHFMDAETAILRCKFLRCSEAGVRIQSFNALDWFVWDSEFDGCALGVTNDPARAISTSTATSSATRPWPISRCATPSTLGFATTFPWDRSDSSRVATSAAGPCRRCCKAIRSSTPRSRYRSSSTTRAPRS